MTYRYVGWGAGLLVLSACPLTAQDENRFDVQVDVPSRWEELLEPRFDLLSEYSLINPVAAKRYWDSLGIDPMDDLGVDLGEAASYDSDLLLRYGEDWMREVALFAALVSGMSAMAPDASERSRLDLVDVLCNRQGSAAGAGGGFADTADSWTGRAVAALKGVITSGFDGQVDSKGGRRFEPGRPLHPPRRTPC